MKTGLAFAILLLAALPAQAEMERAYIGTFTPSPGRGPTTGSQGEGIYLTELDTITGKLRAPRLVAQTLSPSWLAIDRKRGLLYATNESGAGGISAFRIDKASGDLAPIGPVALPSPTHLALSPDGGWLVASSYGGPVSLVKLEPDGTPGAVVQTIRIEGTARPSQVTEPVGNRWVTNAGNASRMHGAFFHPDGRHVVLTEYGLDILIVYALENGQLREVARNPQMAGAAPRHAVWNATGALLYTISEGDSAVTVSAFNAATGALTQRQHISVLPPGYTGTAAAAEILLSKDGRNLYVSNRFHDSIAHFRVGANGLLTYMNDTVTGTSMVRLLQFDPSGRYLLAGGQNNDTIASFRLGADGAPQPLNLYAAAPSPVTLVFVGD